MTEPRPKLRAAQRYPMRRGGEDLCVLHDPLGLCEPFAIDADMGPVLDLLDGQRTVAQVRQSLLMRGTLDVDAESLGAFVDELSRTGWLDDDAFRARWAQLQDEFFEADARPNELSEAHPSLAEDLANALPERDRFAHDGAATLGALLPDRSAALAPGLLDQALSALPRDCELCVAFSPGHHPGLMPVALTSLHYDTVAGRVDADRARVARAFEALPWTLQEEIRHRRAPIMEWHLTVLRRAFAERMPPVLAVLSGPGTFQDRERCGAFLAWLRAETEGRRVFWSAAADLSHSGAAYGCKEASDAADARLADTLLQSSRHEPPTEWSRDSGPASIHLWGRALPADARIDGLHTVTHSVSGPPEGRIGAAVALARRATVG